MIDTQELCESANFKVVRSLLHIGDAKLALIVRGLDAQAGWAVELDARATDWHAVVEHLAQQANAARAPLRSHLQDQLGLVDGEEQATSRAANRTHAGRERSVTCVVDELRRYALTHKRSVLTNRVTDVTNLR